MQIGPLDEMPHSMSRAFCESLNMTAVVFFVFQWSTKVQASSPQEDQQLSERSESPTYECLY